LIAIEPLSHGGGAIPLGQAGQFKLSSQGSAPPPENIQLHVRSNGILHVSPLFRWSSWQQASQPFSFFPESPGTHSLHASWPAPDGSRGHAELAVEVRGAAPPTGGPELAKAPSRTRLWAPSAWEARALRSHENDVLALLPEYVKPGSVVYDIGANLGLYSIVCGRLTGAAGRVYAFEANPVCLYFLRANLSTAGITWSEILAVAVAGANELLEFTINYDNLNLGLGSNSVFFAHKAGHRIQLASRDLDGLVEEFRLRPPDVIKMDIEGGEVAAVRGMPKVLRDVRPVMLMELHGPGPARDTLAILDGHGYRYLDIRSRREYATGADLVAQMPNAPVQVVALPSGRRP
jgi:FkbM family methyltransferase